MRKILYIQYTNPAGYPPLEHSSQILANAGWQVLFLGTQAFGTKLLQFPPHPSIRVLRLSHISGGWRQKLHYLQYFVWVLMWILRWRPTWIYASDPLACPIALLLTYLSGAKIIYHEHDSPNEESNSCRTWFMKIVLYSRQCLGSRIQAVIFPNPERALKFSDISPKASVLTVWNCPSQKEIIPFRKSSSKPKLRLLYHGSIVPSRLPISIIHAMSQLSEKICLSIVGYKTIGHPEYVEELLTCARAYGLEHCIDYLGTVPGRKDLLEIASNCDVGLALLPLQSNDWNEKTMYYASNKPFDYLICGLSLLVSDIPAWNQIFVQPGYGLSCDPEDPESIASTLRWFLEHPNDRHMMGQKGQQRILDEWNYEQQFKPVMKILESANGKS